MNYSYVCKNPLIIAIASLLLSASFVKAEIQFKVEPEKLTIAGTNRDKIKRTLFLIANKPISPANLEISFRELNPANDEGTFFPDTAQTAVLQAERSSKLDYKVPLEFDLSQSTSKGEICLHLLNQNLLSAILRL